MGGRLAGKVAIITGATLGLGKAAALLFAREAPRWSSATAGRTPAHAAAVLHEARALSGQIAYRTCDVMKRDDITALVQFTLQRYERIDVLVNNAIIDNPGGRIEEVSLQDWEEGIFCHLTAPFLFCRQVIPAMIRQGGGSIVNVSSNTALFGNTGISSYGPAKAGMISFTKHLAVACGPHGIRVNALCPARMLTEKKLAMLEHNPAEVRRQQHIYPLGSPALPEQVAEVLLFLASEESAAVTGHNLIADRGAAASNSAAIVARLEADIRSRLEAQGSDWIAMSEDRMTPAALSSGEMARFRRDGYLGPFALCTPREMAALRPAIERVLESDPPRGNRSHNRHLDSRAVYDLATHPAIVERMAALYGPDLLLWRTNFFVKKPRQQGDSLAPGLQLLAAGAAGDRLRLDRRGSLHPAERQPAGDSGVAPHHRPPRRGRPPTSSSRRWRMPATTMRATSPT